MPTFAQRQLIQSRYRLGLSHLRAGRYLEGWPLYEARHDATPKPKLSFPEWQGQDLSGKRLLIWPEQGFGDKIQMARFIPRLVEMGARVTVLVEPALVELFQRSFEVEVMAASGAVSFPDPDYWVMFGSIPCQLQVGLEDLPRSPYLRASEQLRALPAGVRVGVVVKGDPRHANNAHRSLPPVLAQELLQAPLTMSLAPEDSGAKDFQHTADLIAQLDLVITVDTSVAHLAGALGKPVWIMLPAVGVDWRWLEHREDSPWYPSARLYRQSKATGWRGVVDRVKQDLAAL